MSTIKSSDEHLTLNADGTSKDIKFQANGVEKASISSAGAFTSTTIDATKLTGDLPAISGANLTGVGVAGITSTADATAITINATEDVGIGVTPKTTSSSFDSLQIGGGGSISAYYNTVNGAGTDFGNNFYVNSSGTESYIFTEEAAKSKFEHGAIQFYTAPSGSADAAITWKTPVEITNAGHMQVGRGTNMYLYIGDTSGYYSRIESGRPGTGAQDHINFSNGNGIVGAIYTSGSSTVFNTSSDYRLKENVVDLANATDRVKQLKPKRFNFIADNSVTVDGFLAHEVSSVVPEAITGTKDETEILTNTVFNANGTVKEEGVLEDTWLKGKEDGTYESNTTWEATKTVPKYQGIDQSKLVPLLVKTIQELEARITALEA